MRYPNNLTPEQNKALTILNNCLSGGCVVPKLLVPSKTMFQTNFVAYTDSFHFMKKGNLPTEIGWSWNQSNAKQTVEIDSHTSVTFHKMNPRRKRNVKESPSYKIWIMYVTKDGKQIEYLWCEKGLPSFTLSKAAFVDIKACSIGTITEEDQINLKLEDFAFLSEFTDICTAIELGWV
uniref:Uncharacterized protein n=1 Tax=Vannella robusta TaxID=1487602 RepID=A0A7S4M7E7_9EUKA|mmetsp:Transcript_13508/g.17019  ORF Transcript_13508/g.17019 Transcript_13508/m.17019 type:complete len:178 (+) Transcript_13508:74-607(+)